MGKAVRRIVRVAAPVVGTFLGGPLGGAIGGAIGGGIGGGGLRGALLGGLGGGISGFAPQISGALGLSGALGSAATGAIRGAALGGLNSGVGLKGALTGGLLGGAGGYALSGGNIPGLGNVAGASLDQVTGTAGLQGPTQGSGLLGSLSKGLGVSAGGGVSSLGNNLGGSGMNLGGILRAGAGIYSQGQQEETNEEIRRALLQAQQQSAGQLSPFAQSGMQANQQLAAALAGGFNPGDLSNDPGYQFRLRQGEDALIRRLGASGLSQSGAALKAAQEYGQGFAQQEFDNAYQRWLQQNQQLAGLSGQGLGAAGAISSGLQDVGGVNAATLAANQQSRDRLLASLFGGNLSGNIFG